MISYIGMLLFYHKTLAFAISPAKFSIYTTKPAMQRFILLKFAIDKGGEISYNIVYIVYFGLLLASDRKELVKYEFKGS